MIPSLISGWPKTADSAAIRKSQAIASSQPPPKASELTAAIVDDAALAELAQQRVAGVDQLLAARLVHLRERLDVGAGREDDRDRGGDHHRADLARRLDLLPDRAEVLDHLRRDRVHRRVGEPGDRDVAAGLELDRVGLLALVGLRVGVEALAGLGRPRRPWATSRLQDHAAARSARRASPRARSSFSSDLVEALEVGLP